MGRAAGSLRNVLGAGRLPGATVLLLLVITVSANAILAPNFFTTYSVSSNFSSFVPLVAASIGQTIVILAGGIDLSLGALITLSSVTSVVLMDGEPATLPVAVAVAVGVGALGGLVNGLIVAFLRLQAIVATFAMSFVFAGITLKVLPQPGGQVPSAMTLLYRDAVLGIPVAALAILGLYGVWWGIKRRRTGRHIYAVGGDERAAYASGVNVPRVKVLSYVLGGIFASLAALAILANAGSGDPYVGAAVGTALIGGEITLASIAAVVIGGTALRGGVGGAGGSIGGAIILGLIANIVFFAGVPSAYRELIDGAIVIGALALAGVPALQRRPA